MGTLGQQRGVGEDGGGTRGSRGVEARPELDSVLKGQGNKEPTTFGVREKGKTWRTISPREFPLRPPPPLAPGLQEAGGGRRNALGRAGGRGLAPPAPRGLGGLEARQARRRPPATTCPTLPGQTAGRGRPRAAPRAPHVRPRVRPAPASALRSQNWRRVGGGAWSPSASAARPVV